MLGPLLKPNNCWRRRELQYFLHCYWCISPILRHQYITNRYTYHFLKFVLLEYAISNIISKLSQIPDFQSRWLRGGKNIGFISYYMLLAERMTCSCTTVRLRLYDHIGYGCTTIRVLVVQLQNSDFLTESSNLDNILIYCILCIFIIFQIFSKKDFLVENPQILKRFYLEFVRFFSIFLPFYPLLFFLKVQLIQCFWGQKTIIGEKDNLRSCTIIICTIIQPKLLMTKLLIKRLDEL